MSLEKLEASCARILKPDIAHGDVLDHVALCHALKRPFEAYRAWRLWCEQNPRDANGWANAAIVASNNGFMDEAVTCAIELLNLKSDSTTELLALSLILRSATFAGNINQDTITKASESYTQHLRRDPRLSQISEFLNPIAITSKKKIRIGYFWDFFGISSEFCFPFHHDRERFDIVAVAPGAAARSIERIGVDSFIEYSTDDLVDAVRTIRAGEIDVLVDLNGRGGNNYSDLVLEARVAPVQTIFGNFFTSSFSPAIDGLIGDRAILEVIAAHRHTERLVPSTESFMFVRNPYHSGHDEKVKVPPRNYRYRLGTTANPLKISPSYVKFMAKIMKVIPDSSFFYTSISHEEKSFFYKFLFQKEGISPDRIELFLHQEIDYYSMVNEIDLAIDPCPYNGHLSTYEFLARGTPVWSVRGPRMTERYGHMLIGHVGMNDWVFDSQEELITSLVKNIKLKTPESAARLRQRVADSALGDPARATRLMEDAIVTLINQVR